MFHPNDLSAFEYKDGKRDRHEREFLGFGEVITKNLDTDRRRRANCIFSPRIGKPWMQVVFSMARASTSAEPTPW